MKYIFRFTLLLLFLLPGSYGGTAQTKEDAAYYKNLMERFLNDEKLTPSEYDYLYYGYVFQDTYKGSQQPEVDTAAKLAEQNKLPEAYKLAIQAIEEYPLSLKLYHLLLSISGSVPQAPENAVEKYKNRILPLLFTILRSGDGTSKEKAFWVNTVSDEYIFMLNYLGIEEIKQQHLYDDKGSYYDVFDIEQGENFPQNQIWFDITPSLEYEQKLFER